MKNPDIRHLNEMKDVLYDRKWAKKAENFELYYMYREVKKKRGLRYDITVIPARKLGKEYVKTLGHEHSSNYGEIYVALKGEAVYLIQRAKKGRVEDVYAVKAKTGQAAIVPPGYGHITINASKKELVEGNWIDEKCQNKYGVFLRKRGACYYYLNNGWKKNKNYKAVPRLRFEKPLNALPANLSFLYGKK